MLISYGYGQSEIYDIMGQEGYDMTDYEFAADAYATETTQVYTEQEDERDFYCTKLAEYGYSQAEIVVIMESEGYDMTDYVFPTY